MSIIDKGLTFIQKNLTRVFFCALITLPIVIRKLLIGEPTQQSHEIDAREEKINTVLHISILLKENEF